MYANSPNPTKLKKIFYIVEGRIQEEIFKDNPVPLSVARWHKNKLKISTHRIGELKIVDADTDPNTFNTNHQYRLL